MRSGRRITIALVGLVLLVGAGWLVKDISGDHVPTAAPSSQSVPGAYSGLPVRSMSTLPTQVAQTYRLIQAGGPFPFPTHDGSIFENEGRPLPAEKSGYYHEYTVLLPGEHNRGVDRLITGSEHELYYTADHYASFVVVDPSR